MHIFVKIIKYLTCLMLCSGILIAEETQPVPENTVEPHKPTHSFFEEVTDKEKASDDRFVQELGNMLFTLGGILAVIFIAGWFIKRMLNTKIQQVNVTSPIKILERRALSPKTAIYLLEISGKKIAVAESQNGVTHLGEFPETAEEDKEEPSFERIYDDKMKNG